MIPERWAPIRDLFSAALKRDEESHLPLRLSKWVWIAYRKLSTSIKSEGERSLSGEDPLAVRRNGQPGAAQGWLAGVGRDQQVSNLYHVARARVEEP